MWPGPLGATSADVDVGRRSDGAVEHREPVAREQQVAGLETALDLLPDLAVQLVRDEQHHDVGFGRSRRRIRHP